jgi:hypothetical protein
MQQTGQVIQSHALEVGSKILTIKVMQWAVSADSSEHRNKTRSVLVLAWQIKLLADKFTSGSLGAPHATVC